MSPEPSLDAASVARREFTFVRRGCDPDEVRNFVREVAALIEDLQNQLAAQRERAERAEQLDQHRLIELVGEETARVLDAARDAAAEIRTKAQESAARLVEEGQDERQQIVRQAEADAAARKVELLAEVEELRRRAEAELDERRAEGESLAGEIRHEALNERDRLIAEGERAVVQGEADAERIRDAARQEGHQLVAEAEAVRERVLGDLARRRHTARQQLERLNAARERLLAAYTVVRRTVDEATTELTIALPEAKVASDNAMRRARDEPEATVEELEAELSAARLVGLLDSEVPVAPLGPRPDPDRDSLDTTPPPGADLPPTPSADGATTAASPPERDDADIDDTATPTPGDIARPATAPSPSERDDADGGTPAPGDIAGPGAAASPPEPGDAVHHAAADSPDRADIADAGRAGETPRTTPSGELGHQPSAATRPPSKPTHGGRRGLWPFRRRPSAGDAQGASTDTRTDDAAERVPAPDRQAADRDQLAPEAHTPSASPATGDAAGQSDVDTSGNLASLPAAATQPTDADPSDLPPLVTGGTDEEPTPTTDQPAPTLDAPADEPEPWGDAAADHLAANTERTANQSEPETGATRDQPAAAAGTTADQPEPETDATADLPEPGREAARDQRVPDTGTTADRPEPETDATADVPQPGGEAARDQPAADTETAADRRRDETEGRPLPVADAAALLDALRGGRSPGKRTPPDEPAPGKAAAPTADRADPTDEPPPDEHPPGRAAAAATRRTAPSDERSGDAREHPAPAPAGSGADEPTDQEPVLDARPGPPGPTGAAATTSQRQVSDDAPTVDELFARIKAQRNQPTPEPRDETNGHRAPATSARTGTKSPKATTPPKSTKSAKDPAPAKDTGTAKTTAPPPGTTPAKDPAAPKGTGTAKRAGSPKVTKSAESTEAPQDTEPRRSAAMDTESRSGAAAVDTGSRSGAAVDTESRRSAVVDTESRSGADAADPDDPDARWLRRRDDTLSAVEATLARHLKRVLADEQNEVLDLVRQAKPGDLDELVPAFGPHVARYAATARPELEAAAAEGAAAIGGTPPANCVAIADELGQALVSPMRERIGRSLEESGGDKDEITGRLRALYRQWKRQRIGEVVRHYAAAAYAAGTFAATSAGTELRWVVDRSRDACPDAEDNALARGVRKGDPFPTGDRCPPAHPGCRCLVVPAAPRSGSPA